MEASQQLKNRAYYQDLVARRFAVAEGRVPTQHEDQIRSLAEQLGSGELAVVILTLDSGGTAVIDDPEARSAAKQLGVRITGTLGLLAIAIEQEWISEADALAAIDRMRTRGFRIPTVKQGLSFAQYLKAIGG